MSEGAKADCRAPRRSLRPGGEREAAALRANLRRRKEQQRAVGARSVAEDGEPPKQP